MERREFLKKTAIAATAMSAGPVMGNLANGEGTKSKVVIAKDEQCFANNTANQAKIQDMVDHCIMSLTGKSEKAAAYEALFPKPITDATKIVIKYNDNFSLTDSKKSPSYGAVFNALKTGLTSMLGGKFPAANILTLGGYDTTQAASGNPAVTIGSTTFKVKDIIVKNDYFINLAACWAMGTKQGATFNYPSGVTMSQKNMMGAVTGSQLSGFHSTFTNATSPSLAILNSNSMLKEKQVLVLLDGIAIRTDGGPGGSPNKVGNVVIASKDMIAADYQGILILKANGLDADREDLAVKICEYSAKAPYSIGTNDPANMVITTIASPYTTSAEWSGKLSEKIGLKALMNRIGGRPHIVFTTERNNSSPELTIFTVDGAKIWSCPGFEWNGETLSGRIVKSGTYLFSLKVSGKYVRGKINVI
jgi:uncharacterized protein (DUF362 family)